MSETYSDVSDGKLDLEDILNSSDEDDMGDIAQASHPVVQPKTITIVIEEPKVVSKQDKNSTQSLTNNLPSVIQIEEDVLIRRKRQREEEDEAAASERERKNNKLNSINPLDIIERAEGELLESTDGRFKNFDKELVLKKTKIPVDFNMEVTKLEGISSYLYSELQSLDNSGSNPNISNESMKRNNNYGLPKVMCLLQKKLILIGTSYGMILSFDAQKQKLVQVIGQFDDYKTLGQVSSLDVNAEGDTLLVGYDKGTLGIYETYSAACLKQISGVHTSTIIAAKFWKGKDRILSSDVSGNLFLFKIQKLFWTYSFDKQLLLKSNLDCPFENIHYIEILNSERGIFPNPSSQASTKQNDFSIANSTIVALASAASVIIVSLEPQIKSLYKIETPTAVRQQSAVPCISWGRGRNPNSTMDNSNFPILAVGWGPLIQLYQLNKFGLMQIQTTENLVSVGFDIVAHVALDHSIFYLQWISHSMLFLLNSRNQIRILYTGEMVGGEYISDGKEWLPTTTVTNSTTPTTITNATGTTTITNTNPNSIIEGQSNVLNLYGYFKHCYQLESEMHFHYLVRDINRKQKRTFNNSIVVNKQEVIFITNSSIHRAYLFRWEEAINKFVRAKQWPLALKIAQQLNFGKLQSFAELPDRTDMKAKKDFQEFCINLVMSYLEKEEARISQIQDPLQLTDEVNTLCKICMEYFLEIREYEQLFKKTKIYFMRMDKGDLFLAMLEPFILQNKLKRIPNEYFNEILNYFIERKKFRVVQIMIVNLDLSSINLGETIIKCLQYQLFTPLIYINTRKDNDFVAPLYKMYMEYKNLLDDPKANLVNAANTKQTAAQYLYRCLWFLRMTLSQKMYPNDTIDDSKFPQVIRSISSWFFSDQIIIDFAKFDAPVFFDVLYMFFISKPAQILRQKDSLLFKYFNADTLQQPGEKQIQYAEYVHEQIIKKVDKLLKPAMVTTISLKREFCSFIGRVSQLNEITIDLKICQDCVEYLLNDRFFASTEREIMKRASDVMQLIRRLRKQQDILDQLLDKIMDPKHHGNDDDDEDQSEQKQMMESIQEMLDNETLGYLNYLTGKIQRAFDFYFSMMKRSWIKGNRYKIFYWLSEAFRNNELTQEQRNVLQEEIINNVDSLILVSTRYTRNIITTHLMNIQEKIFENLMSKPGLLLDYLEGLLEEKRESVSNDTLGLYIALLCKLEPTRVVSELQKNFYPLDQIIELCRLNKTYDAVAYISEIQGNYQEAISLYTQLFIEECHKVFEKISQKNKDATKSIITTAVSGGAGGSGAITTAFTASLEEKFNQMISSCVSSTKSGWDSWLNMAKNVLSCGQGEDNFWKKVGEHIEKQQYCYEEVNEVFSNIIANLFIEISNHVSIEDIVKLIKQYQHQFQFKSLQRAFTQILQTLEREITFLEEGKQVLLNDFLKQNHKLLKKTTQGNSFTIFCALQTCGQHLHNYGGQVIAFSCGHAFHSRCVVPSKRRKNVKCDTNNNNNTNNNQISYSCPQCMKEEIPYIQQIEQELQQVNQKGLKNKNNDNINSNNIRKSTMIAEQLIQQSTVLNSNNNNNTNVQKEERQGSLYNQNSQSQQDSQSVADDRSNVRDYKHERELFKKKQLKRLQRFDVFVQKDIDNFQEISDKYLLMQ